MLEPKLTPSYKYTLTPPSPQLFPNSCGRPVDGSRTGAQELHPRRLPVRSGRGPLRGPDREERPVELSGVRAGLGAFEAHGQDKPALLPLPRGRQSRYKNADRRREGVRPRFALLKVPHSDHGERQDLGRSVLGDREGWRARGAGRPLVPVRRHLGKYEHDKASER